MLRGGQCRRRAIGSPKYCYCRKLSSVMMSKRRGNKLPGASTGEHLLHFVKRQDTVLSRKCRLLGHITPKRPVFGCSQFFPSRRRVLLVVLVVLSILDGHIECLLIQMQCHLMSNTISRGSSILFGEVLVTTNKKATCDSGSSASRF